MKTKICVEFAAFFLIFAFSAKAQTTQNVCLVNTTNSPNGVNLAIQTNQIVSLVGYDWTDKPSVQGQMPDGSWIILTPYVAASSGSYALPAISQIATGMTNIWVSRSNTGNQPWATFQITTPTVSCVVSNYVPADAIVIPASASGIFQIILESSPDLVNWTAASPGTYGASAGTNRFFRVRAAVTP
jgi:hypothetical protein